MKTKETMKEVYSAPVVEVIEVEVEKGFAGSGITGGNESPEDGPLYPY